MECYICKRKPIEHNLDMIPIEPKGTINRKWVCIECATKKQLHNIPKDVIQLINNIKG